MSKPGWDERDYRLWSKIQCLPSYGLLPHGDRMISRTAVVLLLEEAAKARVQKSPPT
jgi:hypothetical protein